MRPMPAATPIDPRSDIAAALVRMGLCPAGVVPPMTALTGGVSSDIWRVDLPERTVCVKRALPQLRVQAEWIVPVERSVHEWDWYRLVDARFPGACPHPIARDEASNLFAMAFLSPADHPLWKAQLLAGEVDPVTAQAVGGLLGRIHASTAGDEDVARAFATDDLFHALRLEPYLEAAARVHPDHAATLHAIVRTTAGTRHALVHGDVSPKNILAGPHGPVILDAECAWYGDPAFDVAFCLNHLLLKMLARPDRRDALAASFVGLAAAHRAEVGWEPATALDARVAPLLAGLFLARVDGKSPVEYLRDDASRATVRAAALAWLDAPQAVPEALLHDWLRRLGA